MYQWEWNSLEHNSIIYIIIALRVSHWEVLQRLWLPRHIDANKQSKFGPSCSASCPSFMNWYSMDLARCIYFVLGLKILGLCRNSSWHIYVICNIILYLSFHWLWFCVTMITSFSYFYNRFSCKVFIPFDQILCELKSPKLRTIKIPKYCLPFEIFVMLPLWRRWLDNWYHLTMLIFIINSVIYMLLLSCLFFFPVSHNEHFPFMCTTDTWYLFMLSKPAAKTFLIQKKSTVCEIYSD